MRCCGLTFTTCVANVVKNERNGSRLVGDSLKSSLVSCRLRTSCSSASLDCSTPGCSAATGDPAGAAGLRGAGFGGGGAVPFSVARHRTRPEQQHRSTRRRALNGHLPTRSTCRVLCGPPPPLSVNMNVVAVKLALSRFGCSSETLQRDRIERQVLDVDDALELADLLEEAVDLVIGAGQRHLDRDLHVHLDRLRRLAHRLHLRQPAELDLRLHVLDELLDVVRLRQDAQELLLLVEQRVHLVAEREVLLLALLVLVLLLLEPRLRPAPAAPARRACRRRRSTSSRRP